MDPQDTPLRRAEGHFEGADGLRLMRRSWQPALPERVLVVVHGFAEHSGRYEHLGAWFAARGFAVHAYDQRGHGRTPGPRGHVARFELFHDDLEIFLERAAQEHTGLPVTLLGHSMGGLVTADYVIARRPEISGLVTSAAALSISDDLSPVRRRLAVLFQKLLPRLSMGVGISPDGLSRDPEVARLYQADPLVFEKMSAALGGGILEAIERCHARAAEIELPVLVMHGDDDPISPAAGSQRFFDALRSEGCELKRYPGLRHEIFNEPEHEKLFADVLEWIQLRGRIER